MENSTGITRVVQPPRGPCPPLHKNVIKPKPITEDPEIEILRRAAWFERTGPVTSNFCPGSIRDTSEAACATKHEASVYKKLANANPRQTVFKVLNPATGKPDEAFTACVLKRYREDKLYLRYDAQVTSVLKRYRKEIGESSETMVTSYADAYMKLVSADPRETLFRVLNPRTGLPDEVLKACVFKRYRKDQSDSSVTVVPQPSDEVLAATCA
ncbi:uncharacterized protein [Rutidosis leptorrhynchoides]|uniref:uncharacterized protein n=1 Tax=Rutidosis leptorrhynchoides TaxID=125765 RepID=UPI003A99A5FB